MIGRIATRTTAMNSLANLQAGQARTDRIQQQLTSGKAYSKPSDNPVAANEAMRTRSELAVNEQYGRSIADGRRWLNVQENSLDSVTDSLQDARTALVQAGNVGTLDDNGRKALAAKLRGIKEDLLTQANTPHEGRPVFSGTSAAAAVTVDTTTTPATYALNASQGAVTRRVAPGQDVQVNATAHDVFASPDGTTNVFAQLDALALAVEQGDAAKIGAGLTTVDAARERAMSVRSTLAARTNQLEALEASNADREVELTAKIDEVEGVDLAKAMIEFRLQDNAYQAALQATAKTIQPTLLDFLR